MIKTLDKEGDLARPIIIIKENLLGCKVLVSGQEKKVTIKDEDTVKKRLFL